MANIQVVIATTLAYLLIMQNVLKLLFTVCTKKIRRSDACNILIFLEKD